MVFPEYEANREAAIKIMNAFYDKYALGTGEQDKDLAVLFQENNGIHFPRSLCSIILTILRKEKRLERGMKNGKDSDENSIGRDGWR